MYYQIQNITNLIFPPHVVIKQMKLTTMIYKNIKQNYLINNVFKIWELNGHKIEISLTKLEPITILKVDFA